MQANLEKEKQRLDATLNSLCAELATATEEWRVKSDGQEEEDPAEIKGELKTKKSANLICLPYFRVGREIKNGREAKLEFRQRSQKVSKLVRRVPEAS